MRNVQQALKNRGFYVGAVDGLFGPKTQAALKTFQRKTGIAVTGLPDQPTLIKLLL